MKSARVRLSNAGQKSQGYEWYRVSYFHLFHVDSRMVHLRSPYKINSNPVCIIDPEAYDSSKVREV